jgi:hypothetical protein
LGYRGLWSESEHTPPYNVEVKRDGDIPLLLHVFMAWCLIKYRDELYSKNLLLRRLKTFHATAALTVYKGESVNRPQMK